MKVIFKFFIGMLFAFTLTGCFGEDYEEFRFPTDKGDYVLEVEFNNSAGSAQYVGNVVIQ